jgi:hypothetical protein
MTTLDEVRRYEEMHCLAVERLGRDLIREHLVNLHKGVLRDGAPLDEFEKCAIAYAETVHDRTPDERGRYMRWWAMSVMRALLGVTLQ